MRSSSVCSAQWCSTQCTAVRRDALSNSAQQYIAVRSSAVYSVLCAVCCVQCACAVYSVLVLCTVCLCCVQCACAVYSVLVLCTVCLCCVQCACAVYSVLVLCTVCL
eukprot:Lankesteria_metandrocarpae@DN9942_c0_g1_i1.p2